MEPNLFWSAEELAGKLHAALFLSGQGSNAEVLLHDLAARPANCTVSVLVTDAPQSSRAAELAEKFQLPLIGHDIRAFYAAHGENSISLKTGNGRHLRALWTGELREKLAAYPVNFGIFAGFMTLCNIAEDFPCLNVHPGNLLVQEESGRRKFAGLHVFPVERAIADPGETELRSSVILVCPFAGDGAADMDTGLVPGISPAIKIDRRGRSAGDWAEILAKRQPGLPVRDELLELALDHIEKLKTEGDHVVLPQTVRAFASGCYGYCGRQLFFRENGVFFPVKTVEFSVDREPVVWR